MIIILLITNTSLDDEKFCICRLNYFTHLRNFEYIHDNKINLLITINFLINLKKLNSNFAAKMKFKKRQQS